MLSILFQTNVFLFLVPIPRSTPNLDVHVNVDVVFDLGMSTSYVITFEVFAIVLSHVN